MTFAANPAFLEALRTYRILEPAHLDEIARMAGRYPEPRALAKELIQRGWLTPYQVNQLFQGRGPDLLVGSYVLMERLGEGGMGTVFKARNWKLGKVVAIKVIRKDRLTNTQAVRRFHREIRAAAQLNHPNIVLAYDADDVGGTHLFVMEYVQGIDLARLVQAQGALPVDMACEFIRQAALGLQHACAQGLVHRDIKPSNLLVTRAGTLAAQAVGGAAGRGLAGPQSGVTLKSVVKVLDLGLARSDSGSEDSSSGTLTQEGTLMGTPDYLAPEQALDSHRADIRSDLYSLGCTFYYLLTAQVPFPGGTMTEKLLRHQLHEPAALEKVRPEIPPGVVATIRKLMAKRPEDRFQTPAELAAALGSGPSSGVLQATRPLPTPTPGARAAMARTPYPTPPETPAEHRQAPRSPPAAPAKPPPAVSNPFISLAEGHTTEISATSRHLRQVPERLTLPMKWILVALGGILGGVVLAILVLSLGRKPAPVNPTGSGLPDAAIKVAIAANKPWQDTGVDVEQGRQVHITAKGAWGKLGQAPCSAAGLKDRPRDRAVLPAAPALALLGRIGNAAKPIPLGTLITLDPRESGRLFLQINDLDLDSNGGSLEVEITGGSRPEEPTLAPGPTRVEQAEAALRPLLGRPLPVGTEADSFRHELLAFQRKFPGTAQAVRAAELGARLPSPLDRLDPALIRSDQRLPGAPEQLVAVIGSSGWRHNSWVGPVAFRPDGKLLASAGGDRLIYLRDPATGALKGFLEGQLNSIRVMAFSADGKYLASGDESGGIKVWDVDAAREKSAFRAHNGWVRALAFSPDGKFLITGGIDNKLQLKVWNLADGQEHYARAADADQICAMAVAPDGKTLATGGKDGIKLWDLTAGKELAHFTGHPTWVMSVAFAPDGKTLASGGWGDPVGRLWDLAENKELTLLRGHKGEINAVAFSPDGRTVATGSSDGNVRLWEAGTGKDRGAFRGHGASVQSLSFAPNGQALASGSLDGSVRLWDMDLVQEKAAFEGHTGSAEAVAIAPDGGTLLTASGDRSIRLWDLASGKEKIVRFGHADTVYGAAFAPDGRTFATCSRDRTVKIWNAATAQLQTTLPMQHTNEIYFVAFAPDGRTLATAGADETIVIWDLAASEPRWKLTGAGVIYAVAFSPDGTTLASAGRDKTVRLWDLATGQPKAVLEGHREIVATVAYSPDGKTVASGSHDRTIRMWDPVSGRVQSILQGFPAGISGISFVPGSRAVAVGLADGNACLYDPRARQSVAVPKVHSSYVRNPAFTADGKTMATCGQDSIPRLWALAPLPERPAMPGPEGRARSVAFSPDGATLAAGFQDGSVWLCDPATGRARTVLADGIGPVVKLEFSRDGRFLAGAMENGGVSARLWNLDTLKPTEFGVEAATSVSLSPDGTMLAVGANTSLKVLETASGNDVTPLQRAVGRANTVAFAPDSEELAIIDEARTVEWLDLHKGQPPPFLRGPGQILTLVFSPDGRTVYTGHGPDGICIKAWNRDTGGERFLLKRPEHVQYLAISADGKTLAAREGAGRISVWDIRSTGQLLHEWTFPGQLHKIALTPDGRHLAVGGFNGVVYLLRLASPDP